MKIRKTITFCLLSCLVANVTLIAQARSHPAGSPLGVEAASRRSTGYNSPAAAPQAAGLSAEQMDNLLAPIALYPDPLLAQVFPASTFVDQIDQAARWLRGHKDNPAGVDSEQWDVAVKSVAHYPQVVYMMSDKLDWTTALGQAYVNQSTDVLTSVQRLRARAKSAGHLASTPQQVVVVEQEVIKIVPAQPQVIYVPTYNPQTVYVQSGPSTGTVVAAAAISFGVGLAIGAWLNNDCNWHTHTVFYHGWRGTGWVSASSRHVHVNSTYVHSRYSTVHVNSAVVHRNVNYNNINHYSNVNRNVNYNNVNRNNVNVNNVNRNNVNVNNVNTNNVNRNNVNTNNVNRNNVAGKNISSNDARVNSMRGHTSNAASGTANRTATGSAQPAQQRSSAFGRSGSSGETRAASQRGQASRASAQQTRTSGGGGRGGGRSGGGRRRP